MYRYMNGNYMVEIYDDGTKVRYTPEKEWKPDFAENIDIKISNRCDRKCAFCHEGSTIDGDNANVMAQPFWDSLHAGQEVALGGGNVFENPCLTELLIKLKKKNVIANITVHQEHFMKNLEFIEFLVEQDLVKGIGVSLSIADYYNSDFWNAFDKFPNAVLHVIAGLIDESILSAIKNKNRKILILGYKDLRRGHSFKEMFTEGINKNIEWLKNNFSNVCEEFKIVSLDNLAIEQLEVPINENTYMGDEGQFTFYIDAVKGQFAINSTAPEDERLPLMNTVDEMFGLVQFNRTIDDVLKSLE